MFLQPSKLNGPFRKPPKSPLPSWEGIKGRGEVAEIINKVCNILTPTLTLPHRRGRGICLGPELL